MSIPPARRRCRRRRRVVLPLFAVWTAAVALAAAAAANPVLAAPPGETGDAANKVVTVAVEAEAFQFPGEWEVQPHLGGSDKAAQASRGTILFAGSSGVHQPAVTVVNLPRAGRYRLWVRALDFPFDRPGTRRFEAAVAAQAAPHSFGISGRNGYTWEAGGEYDLPAGQNLVSLRSAMPFARVDAVLLTTDLAYLPVGVLSGSGGGGNVPSATAPVVLPTPKALADPLALPTGTVAAAPKAAAPLARIASGKTRIEWVKAQMADGRATVRPRIWSYKNSPSQREQQQWRELVVDADAEAYVVVAGTAPVFAQGAFYPTWQDARNPIPPLTVSAGGKSERTMGLFPRQAIWSGGLPLRFVPRAAYPVPNKPNAVRLTFYPSPEGDLVAEWELAQNETAPRVRLTFTPKASGSYTLGYAVPWRKPLADVPELLLPMMFSRRRFPQQPVTVLDPLAPTPVSLAQTGTGAAAQVWGVSGEPSEIPFAWPNFQTPHFGLMIRDGGGLVHPAIYGPVPGTEGAKRTAQQAQTFRFRVLVQNGDWYAGYRTVADGVFGLRDYRQNLPQGSLTDAVLNMIDLVKNDKASGWWEKARASYQIESRNGSTHAAPLVPLSLYLLTGDEDLYRRRVLPTLEFLLSRNGAHFSPTFDEGGLYPIGGMDGPPKLYGTTDFGGLWQQTGKRTPALRDIAAPANGGGIKTPSRSGHSQPFDDWLGRYEIFGDPNALQQARALADEYIASQITTAPNKELGSEPFMLISFVPDWEGLLRLYEVTKEKKYLDAAAFGARQLMTSVWTQPLIPPGEVIANEGGQFGGERNIWWRGSEKYRLGSPRKPGDTPERRVPAWQISGVGLSLEQPSTYRAGGAGRGQMIFQAVWSPAFLRLARYTGDLTFETYARNAVVGRWTNYPGYYLAGLTDVPQLPRFPYDGPDVSSIYYHHILPHVGWTIDYLVSEAELRSRGGVAFPSLRQFGYAYFDGRTFGHAPGQIGAVKGAWLWLRRGLITLDNPQINYLTAHADGGKQFLVVLMNESAQPQSVRLQLDEKTLGLGAASRAAFLLLVPGADSGVIVLSPKGAATVSLPARGFAVLSVTGCQIAVPAPHQISSNDGGAFSSASFIASSIASTVGAPGTPGVGLEARAAAIRARAGSEWDAYFWCTATPKSVRKATLHYRLNNGGPFQTIEAASYPFEFSVPIVGLKSGVEFFVSGERANGSVFSLPPATLSPPPAP